jgi:hypothetical protein
MWRSPNWPDQPLFAVSHGGASDERGSFGALLATDDEIFVRISGSTEGAAPGSFRAESYGCLAIFRFVYHFRQYHLIDPITCLHHFYCDNQGLITRMNHAAGPLQPFPRHFLRPDIDIELQILDTIRLLGITLSNHHVKGHQDVDTPADVPLTREANLNVECNIFATAALLLAQPAPIVAFLPAGKVAVTIAGTSITRKIPRTIRTLIGRRRQRDSFSRRYRWTEKQFDEIDWPNYRAAALNVSLKKRFFMIKWLNDLLPFQARMNKFGQASSLAGCPEDCLCASEAHSHLI